MWRVTLPGGPIEQLVTTDVEARDLAWRPDGSDWIVALRDGTVQRHDPGGRLLDSVEAHDDVTLAVAWHPEGRSFASVARDGSLTIWPVDGMPRSLPDAHSTEIFGVSYAPDGTTIVTAGADRAIRTWTLSGLELTRELLGHTSDVRDVTHIGDGARLGSAGNDATVRVWGESATPAGRAQLLGSDDGVLAVALDSEHQQLAGADRSGAVHVWDPITGELLHSARLHDTPVTGIDLEAGHVVTVSSDDIVSQWTLASDTRRSIEIGDGTPRSVAMSSDGTQIVVGMEQGPILVLDEPSGEIGAQLVAHDEEVFDLALHPSEPTLVSVGRDGTARAWDLDTSDQLEVLVATGAELRTVAFSPDGALLAVGGADGAIREFQTDGWELNRTYSGHDTDVRDLAYASDGALLASVGRDRSVRLWDTTTGDELASVSPHTSDVRAAVIVGTGERLVSAANDGEVLSYAGPATWRVAVCDLARRDLTRDEWLVYGGPAVEPVPLCASPG